MFLNAIGGALVVVDKRKKEKKGVSAITDPNLISKIRPATPPFQWLIV